MGVILYEMTTGRPHLPEGETPFAVARKHVDDLAKDPREHNPRLPSGLSAIILKCLEKDRDETLRDRRGARGRARESGKGPPGDRPQPCRPRSPPHAEALSLQQPGRSP
ncbi:MAG: hypothetical protein M0C28_20700 [Candidatus Moduliflexus flocculans]|nr:hypothetical protein [Candidatus Moduliflexus flocculans]